MYMFSILIIYGFTGLFTCLLLLLSRFSHVRLCDPIDGSPPGSPIPGILQARTLEWVVIAFSIHMPELIKLYFEFLQSFVCDSMGSQRAGHDWVSNFSQILFKELSVQIFAHFYLIIWLKNFWYSLFWIQVLWYMFCVFPPG